MVEFVFHCGRSKIMRRRDAEKLRRLRGGQIRSLHKAVVSDEIEKVVLTEDDTIYAEKTRVELMELLKEQGIPGASRMNKNEMIQKLMQVN